MSKYTTGEIAKLCGVTVRTVQYYDTRNILVPSELSEGGRRLYSEEDLKRLKVICFLRELDLSINTIGQLLQEEHPEDVIDLLLQQQETVLKDEIALRKEKLDKLEQLQREIKTLDHFSIESIGDIAIIMENRKKLRRVRITAVCVGILADILEWGTIIYGFVSGIWWPFLLALIPIIAICTWVTLYYMGNVAYICPKCHEIFKPGFRESLWARHTPNTRKLTCPHCGHRGFCVETYGGDRKEEG